MAKAFIFFVLFLAALGPILDFAFRVKYVSHPNGVIVISGCSSGIGRHAAFEMASHGYHVFAGVRKDSDIESLNKEAKSRNLKGKVIPVILDVTKESEIISTKDTVVSYLEETKLPFVGLVNNAGVSCSFFFFFSFNFFFFHPFFF
jgi:NADP-dependent 3-hydroxy acid dehydrogenase YdfG